MPSLEDQYRFCPLCATALQLREVDHRQLLACPSCPFVHWNNPKPCASAIVVKGDTVLMLKRAREPMQGYWVLPGGFMDTEDSPDGTAIREMKEETGLTFTPTKVVGAYKIANDSRGHHIDIVYAGDVTGELTINPNEHTEWCYFPLTDLPNNIAWEQRRAIEDCLLQA